MIFTPYLLALLPVLTSAQQNPLQGYIDTAKSYIPDAAKPYLPGAAKLDPIGPVFAKLADARTEKINIRNWQRKLSPKLDGEEEWLVYLTGGNKSCFGKCDIADKAWNDSIPTLTTLQMAPGSPSLHLGWIDCEKEDVLCTAWAIGPPTIYHFLMPRASSDPNNPTPPTPLHVKTLNFTTAQASDITDLPTSTKSKYLDAVSYEGMWHPVDGLLRQYDLLMPIGYVMWLFGSMPSWVMMVGISFISRQFMAKRLTMPTPQNVVDEEPHQGRDTVGATPGAGRDGPATAASPGKATGSGGGNGGKSAKKRK